MYSHVYEDNEFDKDHDKYDHLLLLGITDICFCGDPLVTMPAGALICVNDDCKLVIKDSLI